MRLKKEKCVFLTPRVEYLGHLIDSEGLHPTLTKVRAILNAPSPTNVTQLKSFLGWGPNEESAFKKAKQSLTDVHVLVHFDPQKELVLTSDASPYGIAAVLSHKMADGTERPIEFASRSLHPAERKYSQLDKEALALVFAVKKFHKYLYGRPFSLLTDHKPLVYLFNET